MFSVKFPLKHKQSGVSLLYAVIVMSILLAIGLGISGILIPQIKMLSDIGYSVVAFYAADSGIEKILLNRSNPSGISKTLLPHGATYEVYVFSGGVGGCSDEFFYCIKSVGTYKNSKRAIEINY